MQQITNSESDLIEFSCPIARVYLQNNQLNETVSFISWGKLIKINIIFLETDGIDSLGGEPEEYGIILWQKDGSFSEELKNLISKSLILCSKNGLDINNLLQNCNISLTHPGIVLDQGIKLWINSSVSLLPGMVSKRYLIYSYGTSSFNFALSTML